MNKYLVKIADFRDIRDTATVGAIGAGAGLAGVKLLKRLPARVGESNLGTMGVLGGIGLLGDYAAVKINHAMDKKAELHGTDRHLYEGIKQDLINNPDVPKSDRTKIKTLNRVSLPATVGSGYLAFKASKNIGKIVPPGTGGLARYVSTVAAMAATGGILHHVNEKIKDKYAKKEFKKYAAYKDTLSKKEKYIYNGARFNAREDGGALPILSRLGAVAGVIGGVQGSMSGLRLSKGPAAAAFRKAQGPLQAEPIINRAKNHGVRSNSRALVVAERTAIPMHNPIINKLLRRRKTKLGIAANLAVRAGGTIAGAVLGAAPGIIVNKLATNAYGREQVNKSRD